MAEPALIALTLALAWLSGAACALALIAAPLARLTDAVAALRELVVACAWWRR